MNKSILLLSLFLLFSLSFAETIDLIVYHQIGCHACAINFENLNKLSSEYDLNITEKELSEHYENYDEMKAVYDEFGFCDIGKTPSTLIDNEVLVIGALSEQEWREIFDDCLDKGCTVGLINQGKFTEKNPGVCDQPLTLTVLIFAALIDAINPCTIAVMIMLLGVILLTKGKDHTLMAGLAFIITIFVMYLLMGLGLKYALDLSGSANLFFMVVTVIALVLSIMEINAYFRYQPGFGAVEMPMFLRPYLKTAMKKATSLPGVVAVAILCSIFLLPCSSGPYLIVLGMLKESLSMQALMYLIIYNIVFVLPMFLIVVGIYKGLTTVEDMTELKNKYIKEVHLISGIILFILFLLMSARVMGLV